MFSPQGVLTKLQFRLSLTMIATHTFVIALLATIFPNPLPADEKLAKLIFSAMGCGPYNPADLSAAKIYLAQENKARSSQFLIHLGDICAGQAAREGDLTENSYSNIKELFTKGNTIPSYIVPGDNEWNDRPDPDVGWALWSKHLLGLEKNFKAGWETTRQQARPENFAFVANGVLVIGINLPGGRVHDKAEWARRFRENNAWIETQFAKHRTNVGAAVVCAQANPIGQGMVTAAISNRFSSFTKPFGRLAMVFEKPVLFLHADGHKWTVDNPWKGVGNITRVQVDRIEPKFPPVQITVDTTAKKVFNFERRLENPAWKIPSSTK